MNSFERIMTECRNAKTVNKEKVNKLEAKGNTPTTYAIVGRDDEWTVYDPITLKGSNKLGKGTMWCTSHPLPKYSERRYNAYYKSNGDLLIFINNNDKTDKFQWHPKSGTCYDALERNEIDIEEFLSNHPRLVDAIRDYCPEALKNLRLESKRPLSKRKTVKESKSNSFDKIQEIYIDSEYDGILFKAHILNPKIKVFENGDIAILDGLLDSEEDIRETYENNENFQFGLEENDISLDEVIENGKVPGGWSFRKIYTQIVGDELIYDQYQQEEEETFIIKGNKLFIY